MKQNTSTSSSSHHYVRTIIASLFGVIALWLILASIIVVWLNRTLTDTNVYTKSVSPLVTNPVVQDFFANKINEQIDNNATIQDVASVLLPATETAGKTDTQLKESVHSIVSSSVRQVLNSHEFRKLWEETNRTTHQQLISQINSSSDELTLNLSPAFTSLVEQVKTTKLAPIAEKITIPQDAGQLKLEGESIQKVHDTYKLFQRITIVLVLFSIVSFAISVAVSVHHVKTVRRIALSTGLGLLILYGLLQLGAIIKFGEGKAEQELASAVAHTLLSSLQTTCLVVGVVLVVAAVASKIYEKHSKKQR